MNRFRQLFNRTLNMGHESSPAPPIPQAGSLHPSTSTAKAWTTHDSNLALLECLSTATPIRPAIPVELILQILDHPTRWVRLHSISHPPSVEPNKPIVLVSNRPTGIPLLYTRPFSARDIGLLRNVLLTFRSRDQGWSSNPDGGNWSWFEASLAQFPCPDEDGQSRVSDETEWTGSYEWIGEWMERHDKKLESQPRYQIQKNRHASTDPVGYTIELTEEHELVQRVKENDRIVLWACTCFPEWENRVYEATITVYGMDDLTMDR